LKQGLKLHQLTLALVMHCVEFDTALQHSKHSIIIASKILLQESRQTNMMEDV